MMELKPVGGTEIINLPFLLLSNLPEDCPELNAHF